MTRHRAPDPSQNGRRSSETDAWAARPLWLAICASAIGAVALFGTYLFTPRTPDSWQIVVDVTRLDDEAFVYLGSCPNSANSAESAISVDDDPTVGATHSSRMPFPLPPMTSSSVIVVRVVNRHGGTTHFHALLTELRSHRRVVELSPIALPSVAGLAYVAAVYADDQPAPLPPSCRFQDVPLVTVIFDAAHRTHPWPRFRPSAIREESLRSIAFAIVAIAIMVAFVTPQARRKLLGPDHRRSSSQGLAGFGLALGAAIGVWLAEGVVLAGTVGVVLMVGFSWVAHHAGGSDD